MMKDSIVWRLLKRNISPSQIIGYAVANLVGLAIVMTGIQFYSDVTNCLEDEDALFSSDYLVISKKVTGIGGIMGNNVAGFSSEEIDSIKSQPWCEQVGLFTSSRFNVTGNIELGGRGVSTYLFFESIPDEYFDVKPSGWRFDPGKDNEVPIIISKDYLALYNFGLAATRGYPQLSESMISLVPINISLSGNGKQMYVKGRIIGFSSRLNTIAVPQDFMDWANGEFADESVEAPSRLILEVNSPGDPEITEYLDAHEWESAGDKVNNGRASYFLALVTWVVIAVGGVISCLAFFILLLSLYLLIQKNRRKIHDLMLLGYAPSQVARYYYRLVVITNLSVLAAATGVVLIAQSVWSGSLEQIGAQGSSPLMSIGVGTGLILLVTVLNVFTIRRLTLRNF